MGLTTGRWPGCVVAALLAVFFVSCAGQKTAPPSAVSEVDLVWPPPPDAPRIRYVQSISRPSDVGIKPSGPARVWRWIAGADARKENLSKPFGIALDERDNLCVTDTGANVVCFYDRANRTWKRWEKIGALQFSSPVAVAKRGTTLYVADSGLGRIIVFNESGKLLFQISDHLERPSGLTLFGDHLIVADSKRHAIVTFDLAGRFLSEFGHRGIAPGAFNFPTHVAVAPGGVMVITDSLNSRVQMLDQSGQFRSQLGSVGDSPGHFSRPKGVAADSFGHVYVIDALFDNVQIFDSAGRFLLTLGDSGEKPGQFWLANGIAISSQNEIYIADAYNHRVQVFKYVGQP